MPAVAQWSDILAEFGQRFGLSIAMLIVTTTASFVFGRWWGQRRAQREWSRKEFYDRINISLTLIQDGRLKIRTIMERSLDEVFTNKVAAQKVLDASQRTTVSNPMLPIAKEDCWYLLNFVLNTVAEPFSLGFVKQDLGETVKTIQYVIFLTCEVVGDERIRKVRALIVRQELLENFPYRDNMPELENPWHETRVQTLRTAADLYQSAKEQFIRLEICM